MLALSFADVGAQTAARAPAAAVAEFGFGDVELLDGPFRQAMLRNADYVLSWIRTGSSIMPGNMPGCLPRRRATGVGSQRGLEAIFLGTS
jgi:hypothetical protein